MTNTKISRSLKKYHRRQKTKKDVKKVLWITALFALTGFYTNHFEPVYGYEKDFTQNNVLPQNGTREISIKEKIAIEATKHGIDVDEALAVIACESSFDPNARNQQGSTAKGLAQFIDSTWKNYCKGDVLNEDDNLACFVKLYPKYPHWWDCARILGYLN